MKPSSGFRKFMIVLASMICIFYLVFRAAFTFNLSTPYAIFASFFLYIGELFGIFNLLLYFLQVWEVKEPPMMPVIEGRTVDVFVPTYNEDPQLLRATLEACLRMDYPHRTFVLDDGRRPEVAKLASELGVNYVSRQDNRHAKAGNLNNAFEQTDGEFVIILDADHVPEPQFITRLIGYFSDERVGFVQTPHAFYNFDSFQAQLNHKSRKYWEEGDLFYRVIQPGRNHWNAPIFAGSAAIFRRSALRDIGYIAVETITEDLHTGLRMHSRGWKGIAVTERLIAGQAAPDITTFHAQRLRWGEGNLSIIAYDNPLTLRGLSIPQRLCYFGSMIHWASGLFKLSIYLTPILMLFTGVPPVNQFSWNLAVVTVVYLLVSLLALKVVSNGYGSILNSELFSMVNFWTQIKATFRALFRRRFQKFVVTPKRSATAKRSVWPYIRPQTYLIIAGVLALFWGWSRLAMGISDDKYKPMVPTFWVLLHIFFGYLVTRRAFWPADKRYSTRHVVHLPVEYETGPKGETTKFGVSIDLNDAGMAMIGYEKIPTDREIRIMLRGAGETIKLKGEIRSVSELLRNRTIDGYRYGIAFKNLTAPQIDAINRICLQYAVPRMYAEYEKGNRNTRWSRFMNWQERGMAQRRGSNRYPYHLPLILNPGTTEETACYSSTEDISRDATATFVDFNIPANSLVGFMMPTPLGDVRGIGRVIRSQPQFFGGRNYYRTIIEFQDFEGQGRTTLHSLVNPAESAHMNAVLKPDKKPIVPKMAIPLLIISLIAIPLILAQMGVFRFVHRDDFILRQMLDGKSPLSETQQQRELDRIYTDTKNDKYPSTDRLVLVLQALAQSGRQNDPEAANMVRELAGRDKSNLDLQSILPGIMEKIARTEDAEKEYARLKVMEEKGEFKSRPDLVERYKLAAARVAANHGDFKLAAERFKPLLETQPGNIALRDEYAGILIRAKNNREAISVLKSADNLDLKGHQYLIAAWTLDKQYDDAEKEARELVRTQNGDPMAEKILAEVLSARGYGKQSRDIIERLLKQNPNDPNLRLKIAQIDLDSRRWDDALERFQAMIDANEKSQEVLEGWVDAASSYSVAHPNALNDKQKTTALMIFNKEKSAPSQNSVYLARLSWVLQNASENDKSRYVLEQALLQQPGEQSIRDQLAGVLINAGEWEEAIKVMGGTTNPAARKLAVGVHIRKGELDKAELEARAILEQNRDDLETEKLVADIASWRKDFDRSLTMYEKMRAAHPTDRNIQARIAEISLWRGGDYPGALDKFTKLLQEDFNFQYDLKQPTQRMWDGFIDAASGSASLDAAQSKMALKVAAAKQTADSSNPVALSRMAWVLLRSIDSPEARDEADKLLTKAMAMKPVDPAVRQELSGVLARADRYGDAIAMLDGLPEDDTNRMRMAMYYASFKKFDKAEEQVTALLLKKPNDRSLLRLKADLQSWKGTPEEQDKALASFEQLIKQFPDDPELPIRQAEIILWKKDYETALQRFQGLLNQYPENPQIWAGFATSAANIGRPLPAETAQLARQIVDRAMVTNLTYPLIYARLAMLSDKLKDTAKTEIFVSRAVQNKPADHQQRKELAILLAGMSRAKEAVLMFEGLTLIRSERKDFIYAAASAEDMNAAAKQARLLVQEDPKDLSAQRILADVLSWKGDFQESLTIYERLLRAERNDRTLPVDIANVTLWMSDYPEAMKKYGSLLAANFEQAKLWEGFIDATSSASLSVPLNAEQKRLALLIYDRWLQLDVPDPARFSRLAWVMLKVGDRAKANEALNRALALNPQPPSIRKELAGVLAALSRNTEALALVKDLPSVNFADRNNLATLLTANKQFDDAERELREMVLAKPQDKDLRKQLADVMLWNGKYKEAESAYSSLIATNPDNADLKLKRAQALLWSNEGDLATRQFQLLLESDPNNAEFVTGYIDALATAKNIDPAQESAIRRILAKIDTLQSKEPDDQTRKNNQTRLLTNMGRIMAKLSANSRNGTVDELRSKQLYMQALRMDPKSRNLWNRYAQSLMEMRRYSEAESILSAILVGDVPSVDIIRSGN